MLVVLVVKDIMEAKYKIAHLSAHEIASLLISLLSVKRAEVARATGNNPANLSQWLQGRDKLLSVERQESVLQWLGLINGKLDGLRVHHWQVGNDFSSLRDVLQATENPITLASLKLHKADGDMSYSPQSTVLLEFDREGTSILILVSRQAKAGKHPLQLDANSLGFGRDGQDVQVLSSLLERDPKEISLKEFYKHIGKYEAASKTITTERSAKNPLQAEVPPDQLLVEMERLILSLRNDVAYLRSHEAGLRGVIREALKIIREIKPGHPFIDKEIRKGIYEEYNLAETDKHKK